MNFLQLIGSTILGFFRAVGHITHFTILAVSHCFRPPFYFRLIFRQIVEIGYYSLPVVGLTTLFAGMVLALQSYTGFARFAAGAESSIAKVVVLSIIRLNT